MNKSPLFILPLLSILAAGLPAQVPDTALYFDGIDDRVTIGSHPAYLLGSGDFSIEAWIRNEVPDTAFSQENIVRSDPEWHGGIFSSTISFRIENGQLELFLNVAAYATGSGADLRDGQCHHVAAVVDWEQTTFSSVSLFVDGNYVAWYTYWFQDSVNVGTPLRLGGLYKGTLREFRLWKTARSQSQIQNTMNTVLSGSEPDLIAYWRMNEGTGQLVTDYSPTGNTGFLGYGNSVESADPAWFSACTGCPPPPAGITTNAPTTICQGGSVLLSANTGTGLMYQWKKNGTYIPGATAATYAAAATGSYSVQVTDACGVSVSSPVAVTVKALPSANITASGPTTICTGGSVTLHAVVAANRSYQWKRNGVLIAGATSPGYTATTSGAYKVIVTNTVSGCSKTTGTATTVTVKSNPSATINPAGTITFCAGQSAQLTANSGAGFTYKWKKNGVYIGGATAQSFLVTTAGLYKVEVTGSNGCSKTSKADTVVVPCRETNPDDETEDPAFVVAYPNPSSGDVYIESADRTRQIILVRIRDVLGRVLYATETSAAKITIPGALLKPGLYFAELIVAPCDQSGTPVSRKLSFVKS